MGAPVASARAGRVPGGIQLRDGYQTLITFENLLTAKFFEKTVGVPGGDGGDQIDTTTMLNTTWRTMVPRALKTLTEFPVTAAYDPDAFDTAQLQILINSNQTITIHFPDLSTLAFYGFLKAFEVAEHTEGEQPEMTLTIVPTNTDPSDFSEQGPVVVEVAGT